MSDLAQQLFGTVQVQQPAIEETAVSIALARLLQQPVSQVQVGASVGRVALVTFVTGHDDPTMPVPLHQQRVAFGHLYRRLQRHLAIKWQMERPYGQPMTHQQWYRLGILLADHLCSVFMGTDEEWQFLKWHLLAQVSSYGGA